MRLRQICTGAALTLSLLQNVSATAPYTQETQALMEKIDVSFSALKTGMSEEEAQKLKDVKITGKFEDGITVIDADGVEHDFYDGMWQKLIQIKPNMPKKPLKALDIGTARSQKQVLTAMRKFTGLRQIDCTIQKTSSGSDTRKFGAKTFCKQYFQDTDGGYVWAAFNKKDQLTTLGFQAWDPF